MSLERQQDPYEINNESVYRQACLKFLPTSRLEMQWRHWDCLDVLLIQGDAYVDHPTFGVPCLGRWLTKMGLKVGIISQPNWRTLDDFQKMGRPRLFIGISSGTVDSMINNYTANKRLRRDDMYSEGGKGGNRPDYASLVYCEQARKVFADTPIIAGGVEVSLRRLAHYDFWQNRVKPSFLFESAANLMVFGMGERQTQVIVQELRKAQTHPGEYLSLSQSKVQDAIEKIKIQRGVSYLTTIEKSREISGRLVLPSYEEVKREKKKFAKAAYIIEFEASPYNGKTLVQYHGSKAVVVNSPALPLTTSELDSIYEMPFTKEQHPSYHQRIPAADMIRFSVASTRGCFGGCSFCAITLHQGRVVQSRSEQSILKELGQLPGVPGFKGIVSDIGGPTANMYQLRCKSEDIQSKCRKLSCVHPKVCPHLHKDHTPQVELLKKAREMPGIRKVHVASGLRYDLALSDEKAGTHYLKDLISHHVGGHLKVAPEHLDEEVLFRMKKPGLKNFDEFVGIFKKASQDAGKEQYLVPYFISGFPGTTHEQMQKVYQYLQKKGWKLQQVQAFIPTPMTLATAMYWTGIDPMSKKALFVAKNWKDRKLQQALLQPHRASNEKILRNFLRRDGNVEKCEKSIPGEVPVRKDQRILNIPSTHLGPKLLLDIRK